MELCDYAETIVVKDAKPFENAVFWESKMSSTSCGRSASCSIQATKAERGYRETNPFGKADFPAEAFARMGLVHRDNSFQFEPVHADEYEEECAVERISWNRMHSTMQLQQASPEASFVLDQRSRQARNVAESLSPSFINAPVKPPPLTYTGLNPLPLEDFSDEIALRVSVQPELSTSLANNDDCFQQRLLMQSSSMPPSPAEYSSQESQFSSHDMPHGVVMRAPLQPGLVRNAQDSVGFDESVSSVSSMSYRYASEPPESEGYTMFIQNIPARFSQEDLLQRWPPENSYNLLYLPYSHKMRRSMGCATINFVSYEAGSSFQTRWNGKPLAPDIGAKRLRISESRTQGFSSNIEFIRTSPHILRTRNPNHLPTVIQADGTFADFSEVLRVMNSGCRFSEHSEELVIA